MKHIRLIIPYQNSVSFTDYYPLLVAFFYTDLARFTLSYFLVANKISLIKLTEENFLDCVETRSLIHPIRRWYWIWTKKGIINGNILIDTSTYSNLPDINLWHFLQTVLSVVGKWLDLYVFFCCGETIALQLLTVYSSMKHFPVSFKRTKKLCTSPSNCLGSEFNRLHRIWRYQITLNLCKIEEISMVGKSNAVPLLLWLLVAPFLSQTEGNSTIPLPEVRFKTLRASVTLVASPGSPLTSATLASREIVSIRWI